MSFSRRAFLQCLMASTAGVFLAPLARAAPRWPDLEPLRELVGDRLIEVPSPLDDGTAFSDLLNPFFLENHPGATQTAGWLNAWRTASSPWAVAAESTADVVAAVKFARQNRLKVVVKGTGHDYLGRSCDPEALLIWTHRMRKVEAVDYHGRPALSVQAGTRWLEAYQAAASQGRYVQGGGCTSVGAAGGFLQGSGYGSFSKRFGTGAANVLELEVVTADGEVRVANEKEHPDLFWALRGGGGGTFGVVTRATLLSHPLPELLVLVYGSVQARDEESYRELIGRFVAFYPDNLNNPHWGEQVGFGPDNTMSLSLTCLEMTEQQAREAWEPLLGSLEPDRYTVRIDFTELPLATLWDEQAWDARDPGFIVHDPRSSHFWWAANQGEVSAYIFSYQSMWVPLTAFAEPLVEVFFQASRHCPFKLHFNKGLSGAAPDAVERTRATSVNPAVFEAAALIIACLRADRSIPGVAGHEPDLDKGKAAAARVQTAMDTLRAAMPNSGAYSNEADFFEPNWQSSFWGENYPRLLAIKRKYDPESFFRVHHGVGSE